MIAPPRRAWIALGVAAAALGAGAPAGARIIERVVAVVNEDIILKSELDARVRPLLARLRQIPDPERRRRELARLRRQALDTMVDDLLIRQQAARLKVKVREKDLELAIKDVTRRNNLTRAQLVEALAREGMTLGEYKRRLLRPQLLRQRVINVVVRSRVSVSDAELRARYQRSLRALGVQEKVRARHIFVAVRPGASPAEVARRRRLALEILRRVKAGEDFGELARKFSQDGVTKKDGGDLGYFARGSLPAEIEEVVFAMKKGQVRGPLRSERGFHLVKLVDRKASTARPFAEVRGQLRRELVVEKLGRATRAWLKETRRKAHVEIRL